MKDTYNIPNLKKSFTMTDGEMDKLKQKQKEIIEQINEYQSNCKHEHEVIKMVQEGSTASLKVLCRDCDILLRYPTQEETKRYLNNEKD